jgi:VanZ family protein
MELRLRQLWLGLGWLMICAVVFLSLTPHPPKPLDVPLADKLEHAMGYAVLAWWFFQLFPRERRWHIAVALFLLGVAIEIAQAFTPTRNFELADMVADGVGVAVGGVLMRTPLRGALASVESILFGKAV